MRYSVHLEPLSIIAFTTPMIGMLTKATETIQGAPIVAQYAAAIRATAAINVPRNCPRFVSLISAASPRCSISIRCFCSASAILKIRSAPSGTISLNRSSTAGGGNGPCHSAEIIWLGVPEPSAESEGGPLGWFSVFSDIRALYRLPKILPNTHPVFP